MQKGIFKLFIIIVMIAIALGGLFINKNTEKKKTESSKINSKLFKKVAGNYQGIDEVKWHLYIGVHETSSNFFTIYDNGGDIYGKEIPWIRGKIVQLDQESIVVEIDYFEDANSKWKLEDNMLKLQYKIEEETIVLSNEGYEIHFGKQDYAVNPDQNQIIEN